MRPILLAVCFLLFGQRWTVWSEAEKPAAPLCPHGWTELGVDSRRRCVRPYLRLLTWWEAEEACRGPVGYAGGGHLVSIVNGEENDQLAQALRSAQGQGPNRVEIAWIGLGKWCPQTGKSWTDGSRVKVDFRPWSQKASIPLSSTSEDFCVFYDASSKSSSGRWVNQTCSARHSYICERLQFNAPSNISLTFIEDKNKAPVVLKECGDVDWCYDDESQTCYKLSPAQNFFWERGRGFCQSQDADLASIHSEHEMEFIMNMTKRRSGGQSAGEAWIGLNLLNAARDYSWSDGTPMDYLASVISSTGSSGDPGSCVSMYIGDGRPTASTQFIIPFAHSRAAQKRTGWNSRRCDQKFPALCSKEADSRNPSASASTNATANHSGVCPENWLRYNDKCYRFFGAKKEDRVNSSEAMGKCLEQKGKLVSIQDIFEQAFVLSLLRESETEAFIGLEVDSGRLRWSDETPVRYTHFTAGTRLLRIGDSTHVMSAPHFKGRTVPFFSEKVCVFISVNQTTGFWDTMLERKGIHWLSSTNLPRAEQDEELSQIRSCENASLGYVCKRFPDPGATPKKEGDACGVQNSYTFRYTENCYALIEDVKTWKEGEQHCNELGNSYSSAHLFSTDELFEWSFIFSRVFEKRISQEIWIGLSDEGNFGSFNWSSGLKPRLTPWASGEPSSDPIRSCVSMHVGSPDMGAQWFTRNCNSRLPFLCKFSNESIASPTTHNQTGSCGRDWFRAKNRCYKIFSKSVSGYQAHLNCFRSDENSSAHLAAVPTEDDLKEIVVHLKTAAPKDKFFYIGLVQRKNGGYSWMDSSPVSFVRWGPGEPQESADSAREICVQMDTQGRWFDIACWHHRPYICSKQIDYSETTPAPTKEPSSNSTPTGSPLATTTPTATTVPSEMSKSRMPTSSPSAKTTKQAAVGAKDQPKESSSAGLSGGSIFGIVACVLFFVLLGGFLVTLIRKGRLRLPWRSTERGFVQFDALQDDTDGY